MQSVPRLMCILAMLTATSAADAVVIGRQLNNVTFEDGGTASGHLTFDTDLDLFTDFDIVVTAGSLITPGFEYRTSTAHITGQDNQPGSSFLQLVSLSGAAPDGDRELFLAFAAPLAPGEPAAILYQGGPNQISYERQFLGQHLQKLRRVIGPQLDATAPIPEPSAMAFCLLGAGLMCWRLMVGSRRHSVNRAGRAANAM